MTTPKNTKPPKIVADEPLNLDALPDSHLLNDIQAAEALGISPGTLSVWRSTGRYNLPYSKIGRRVKYKVGDLREFIQRRTQTHTGQMPTVA